MFLAADQISIPEALLLSLIGFTIVFTVLVVLMIVISIITRFSGVFEKKAAPASTPAAQAPAPDSNAGKVPAPGSVGECRLHSVDDQTAALLMAIVADNIKVPLNELRFISIKEV